MGAVRQHSRTCAWHIIILIFVIAAAVYGPMFEGKAPCKERSVRQGFPHALDTARGVDNLADEGALADLQVARGDGRRLLARILLEVVAAALAGLVRHCR